MPYTFVRNQAAARGVTKRFVTFQGTHMTRGTDIGTPTVTGIDDNLTNILGGTADDPQAFLGSDFHPVDLAQIVTPT